MKINKVKPAQLDKIFFEDEKISIKFQRTGSKLSHIHARNKKKKIVVKIVKDNILEAFKRIEKFFRVI